ncbi:hypothetical protein, partial [Rhodococcus sp. EPR-157]|uniref:hypothetical protein n=1 Tax=Rhodococcus sp. EPR-157 TaxID=1813677 RepID=UPI000B1EF58A
DISGVDAELAEREPVTTAGSPRWTQVDIGPAREHLGWVPTRSIHRSIEDFWLDTLANTERPHTQAGHPTRT